MTPQLLAAASLLAAWSGMTVLCFASRNQRHRMHLPEQQDGQRRGYRAAAVLLLSASLLAAVTTNGTSFGIVLWICQAGLAGLALVCVLPYAATWVTRTSRIAALLLPVLFAMTYRV